MLQTSNRSKTLLVALFLFSLLSGTSSPNAIPLVLLLATLQLYIPRDVQNYKSIGLEAGALCTSGVTLGHALPSLHALSSPIMSILVLIALSGLASFISITAVYFGVKISKTRTSWARVTAFPALWATTWGVLSLVSPVGRLVTWSPVISISPYNWTSQLVGPWGIDFIVAAWSVVIAETVRNAFDIDRHPVEEPYRDEPLELPPHDLIEPSTGSHHTLALAGFLIALVIPSIIIPSSLLPTFTADTTPFTVGCALPRTRLPTGEISPVAIDEYIAESRTMTRANIIIWPEGAVKWETPAARVDGLVKLQQFLKTSQELYVGVSFEDFDLNNSSSRALKRNGFLLLNYKKGIVIEYYKRNLVPLVESFSTSASNSSPEIYTIPLNAPAKTRKPDWSPHPDLNFTRPISVTSSICLDFASPSSFTSLDSRPSLILAPARTWHESVGYAMWNQAKQRSFETGSTVVWCDGGEGGVSGVIGRGHGEPIQAGEGSWTATIGLSYPFDESRTGFTVIGNFGSMLVIWFLCAGVGAVEFALMYGNAKNWTPRELWSRARGFVETVRERRRIANVGAEAEDGERRPLIEDEESGQQQRPLIDF